LQGLPVSPGLVTGKARVILQADIGERIQPGEILVAPYTDPGWTPYFLAAAGLVVYAGNELRGYGNLILLKHAGGWISAYAHCDLILVRRGQQVRRGQIIARVGSTGNVGSPQLHFELRRGDKPVDPRAVLAPLSTAARRDESRHG
jgi:phosphohistidine swiveling domain-containing protein